MIVIETILQSNKKPYTSTASYRNRINDSETQIQTLGRYLQYLSVSDPHAPTTDLNHKILHFADFLGKKGESSSLVH